MSLRIILAGCRDTLVEPLRVILTHEGHQVLAAMDWSEALRLAGEHPPDVVLIEERLPLFDGLALVRKLLPSSRLPGSMRVILVTNSLAPARREAAIAVGCTHCLRHPVEMHALVEAIEGRSQRPPVVVIDYRSPAVVIDTK